MRKRFLQLSFALIGLLITNITVAQNNNAIEAGLRSNGKIYTVMAVCITILVGLILYLISIDRKIKKIENND
jgi:hypothetical protein